MKCNKQFRFYRLEISKLWEVHLDLNTWERIQNVAKERKCTLSWITRYCAFRLARKKNLRMFYAMKIHSKRIKNMYRNTTKHHRHIICLYGEDEKLLRLTAMQLGVTVSQLIRLALIWFLPKIEKWVVGWPEIFFHGTKICRYLDISRKNMLKIPFYDFVFYTKWTKDHWWKIPWHGINIPFSPETYYLHNKTINDQFLKN